MIFRTLPFGQTLKVWRQARGLTQEQLAARTRVSRPNLSAMERGKREVSLGTLRALAVGLEIRPGVLADGIPPSQLEEHPTVFSREVLERIADAVVGGGRLREAHEQRLVEALRQVTRHRVAAARVPPRRGLLRKRRTEAAWLFLESAHSRQTLDSLLQRIADRQGRS